MAGLTTPDPLEEYYRKYDPDRYESYLRTKKDETARMQSYNTLSGLNDPETSVRRGLDAPRGTISALTDFLSRGNYAAAKFSDVLINEEGDALSKFWDAFKGAGKEFFAPEERLVFKDVIETANPVWAANNKGTVATLGFIADVVVDPLNALSFGAGSLFRQGVTVTAKNTGKLKTLNKVGERFFQRVASELTGEAGEKLTHKPSALQVIEEVISPTTTSSYVKTLSEKELLEASIRKNVSAVADELGDNYAVIRVDDYLLDHESILNKKDGKINLLHYRKVREFENKALYNNQDAQTILDSLPTSLGEKPFDEAVLKADPLHEVRNLQRIEDYSLGSKDAALGRGVGLLIPKKYFKKVVYDRKTDTKKIFAAARVDPNELRYIVPDSPTPLNRAQFDSYRKQQKFLQQKELSETLQTEQFGNKILKDMKLAADDLFDKGGAKVFGKTLVTSDEILGFMDRIGATSALKTISDLPGFVQLKAVADWASLNFNLTNRLEKVAPEWMRFRGFVESEKNNALNNAVKLYDNVFNGLTKEQRIQITDFMTEVGQQTRDAAAKAGMLSPSFELGKEVMKKAIDSSTLNVQQKKTIQLLAQNYTDWHKTEILAGKAGDFYVNYSPARYKPISKALEYKQFREWQTGKRFDPRTGKEVTPTEDFSFKKYFESPEEAAAQGYKPIKDAGQLFLLRHLEHQSAIRQFEWERFIKDNWSKLDNAPVEVQEDLFRLGERVYVKNRSLAGQWAADFFHNLGTVFRKSATVARPSFGVKQLVSNAFQVAAKLGSNTFRMVDPTIINDSWNVAVKDGKTILTEIKTVFGDTYTPEMLEDLFRRYPVVKGVSIENIGVVPEGKLVKKLTEDAYNAVVQKNPVYRGSAGDGLKKAFAFGAHYLDWPSKIEDFYRTSTFLTALRLGHSPDAAIKIVDDALFNYTTSLSNSEKFLRSSLIPFYSFQRFGGELLAKTIFQTPGRAAFLSKTSPIPMGERNREFFRLYNEVTNGETLSEAERQVAPDYLMAQPHAFTGFDNVSGVIAARYKTFNSMVFMDVINAVQLDHKGEFDLKATLIKGAAAQMAPWIKVPLETLIGRKFFNDELLTGSTAGSVGNVDYDHFISNVTSSVGAYFGGTGAAAGYAAGQAATIPGIDNLVKWAIGWEDKGTDPITGQRKVYISPAKWHWLSSMVPSVGYGKTIARNDMTSMDKILYGTFGIGTSRVDLQRSAYYKGREMQRRYDEKLYEFNRYLTQGRAEKADMIVEELQEILEYNAEELSKWRGEIRGGLP